MVVDAWVHVGQSDSNLGTPAGGGQAKRPCGTTWELGDATARDILGSVKRRPRPMRCR